MTRRLLAWGVHLLTASGAVLALLSLQAILAERWVEALLWLFVALVVDGIDGSLARFAHVGERLPRISGEVLDLVVDYLTYVFVPAIFILRAELIPEPLGLPLAAAILLSSLYVFARSDMKTADGYFRGFPALWNVVVFYLFALQLPAWAASLLIVTLIVMTFAPIHVVHPFRVSDYGRTLPIIAIVWAGATAALLWPAWTGLERVVWMACSLAAAAILAGLGLWRSFPYSKNRK